MLSTEHYYRTRYVRLFRNMYSSVSLVKWQMWS